MSPAATHRRSKICSPPFAARCSTYVLARTDEARAPSGRIATLRGGYLGSARPKGHRKPLSGFSDPPSLEPSADAPPGHRLEALTVLYPDIVFGAINPIGQARRARR